MKATGFYGEKKISEIAIAYNTQMSFFLLSVPFMCELLLLFFCVSLVCASLLLCNILVVKKFEVTYAGCIWGSHIYSTLYEYNLIFCVDVSFWLSAHIELFVSFIHNDTVERRSRWIRFGTKNHTLDMAILVSATVTHPNGLRWHYVVRMRQKEIKTQEKTSNEQTERCLKMVDRTPHSFNAMRLCSF